jgi:hypothetical protein
MPGKVMVEEDSSDTFFGQIQSTTYTSGDAYSRQSYLVIRSRYSEYFQAKNEKAYFKQLLEASVEEKIPC